MDPVVSALLNNGGFGILAAVLYLLHTKAIASFREQQREERALFHATLSDERARQDRHHEEVMTGIRGLECHGRRA